MIQLIEQAMADKLRIMAEKRALDYNPVVVASQGRLFSSPNVWTDFPALWVGFTNIGTFTRLGHGWRLPARFSVLVGVRNEDVDTGASPNIYRLIKDVHETLAGERLGLDILPLDPGRVITLRGDSGVWAWNVWQLTSLQNATVEEQKISICSVEFRTAYDLSSAEDANALLGLSSPNPNGE